MTTLPSIIWVAAPPTICAPTTRAIWSGVGNYDAERAAVAIEANRFDLVAIGRPLIANPDYLDKVKNGEALVPYADTMLTELV